MIKPLLTLFAILILGFFLRFQNVESKELWYDESFTAEIITNSYTDLYKLSALDVHPPLYYFVLKAFTSVFGNSELALRFPSIIFGVALVALVHYLILYMTSNKIRALFAALVVATNPFLVIYSREARSYSMLAFLTVLAFFLILRAVKTNKYLSVAVVLPLLFLTHYISVFVILIFSFILLSHNKKTIFYLLPVAFVIVFWIPIIMGSSKSTGLTWVPQFSLTRVPASFHAFLLGTDTNEPRVAPPLNPFPINTSVLSIIIFVAVGTFIIFSKPKGDEKLLLICAVIPMILVAITSKFYGFNFFVERFMIGYGAILLVYLVVTIPKPYLFFPYVFLSIYLVLSLKSINIGYRELAKYNFDKPLVMTDAGDFINAKYYVKDIKLHAGDWRQWVIIHPEDIYDESGADRDFYLVNRGPLEEWKPVRVLGEFYFYDWDVVQVAIPR